MVDLAKGMETAKVADMLDSYGNIAGKAARQRVLAKFLEKAVPVVEESAKTTFWERLTGAGDREVDRITREAKARREQSERHRST